MAEQIDIPGMTQEQQEQLLPENLIFLGYRGSISHGMYIPSSDPDSIDDKDTIGVFVGPIEHYLGFTRKDHKEATLGEWDAVSYEIRKLVRLLLKGNPNVLGTLWLDRQHVLFDTPLFDKLRKQRRIFVAKSAYKSFAGYANSQLKRMTHFEFKGYMGKKRKQLVEKFGYDTKNAAHLIRLLRMGIEFVRDGELQVERQDRAELLDIKKGRWTLEQVKSEAERLYEIGEQEYDKSSLPEKPSAESAEKLTMEIITKFHNLGIGDLTP